MDAISAPHLVPAKPLRVWPGLAVVGLQWLAWFGVPTFLPETGPYGIFIGLLAGAGVLVWWLAFSRARWSERLGVIVLIVLAVMATKRVVHESIAGGGMGMLMYIYAVPVMSLALAAGATAGRRMAPAARGATVAGVILLACTGFTLVRTGGITGEGDSDLHGRWTPTPEERLLARGEEEMRRPAGSARSPAPNAEPRESRRRSDTAPDMPDSGRETGAARPPQTKAGSLWPGFRGANRDGIVTGVRIETTWSASPPVELWRRPIGPGWSSFAVHNDLLYTQEQRGDEELVSCYSASTGSPVWVHRDATRFWESNAGAGPRATPTLHDGRVYTLGATGLLNALDARTGEVVWSRNAAADVDGKLPHWGFSASPLVVGDAVVTHAGGLAAYEADTGQVRWLGHAGGGSYSSPQLVTLHGVDQIVMLNGGTATGVAPADGASLWVHAWQSGVVNIVQPALVANGDLLIAAADEMGGIGLRRIAVAQQGEAATESPAPDASAGAGERARTTLASGDIAPRGWTAVERWTTRGLKPYYNDFVVHKGHAYGFDNSILACVSLEDGGRKWKGGRYGHGQLILLADQGLLLVLSEHGELALVGATPDQFREIARVSAITGKTWNHPVLADGLLFVRNDQEMAAFRLSAVTE